MDATLIAPLLVTSKHLKLEDVEKIISCPTKGQQVMQLLVLLHRAGKLAYQGLFKALGEEKELRAHQELLIQLEEACECRLIFPTTYIVIDFCQFSRSWVGGG